MSIQKWNPNFMDLSPMFELFRYLEKQFSNMLYWPDYNDLNQFNLKQKLKILTRSGKEICFVPPVYGRQSFEQKYESKIYLTGQVQTRVKNWHDFFNALVWQIFPHAKSAINELHYQTQLYESINRIKQRSALRDALTLFDESGVVVVSTKRILIQLLKDYKWKQLFWREREAVLSAMRFFVFGHGLYEKALNPYTGMTGKGILFHVDEVFFDQPLLDQLQLIDLMLESFLLQALSSNSDLTPIPLLGYPGWIKDNINEAYYENEKYFRNRQNWIKYR